MQTRKSLRLSGYDYSQNGVYFVTVCTTDKAHTLGAVTGDRVVLTKCGKIVDDCIRQMPAVEKYAIMPDHIHLLVRIAKGGTVRTPSPTESVAPEMERRGGCPHPPVEKTPGLPMVVRWLKWETTRRCGFPLWQRSYHDHIVRDETDYLTRWNYIDTNPVRWGEDEYA